MLINNKISTSFYWFIRSNRIKKKVNMSLNGEAEQSVFLKPDYNVTKPLPPCDPESPRLIYRNTPFPPEKDCRGYIGLKTNIAFGRYKESPISFRYAWKPEPDYMAFWTKEGGNIYFAHNLHDLFNSPDNSSLLEKIESGSKEINQYGKSLGIRPQIGIAFIEKGKPGYIAEWLDHLAYRVIPDSLKQTLDKATKTIKRIPIPEVHFDFTHEGLYKSSGTSYETLLGEYIKLRRELKSLGWNGETLEQHTSTNNQDPQLSTLVDEYQAVEDNLAKYERLFNKTKRNKETAFKNLDEEQTEKVAWSKLSTILERYSYLVYFKPEYVKRRFDDKWEAVASSVQKNIDKDNPVNNVLQAAHYLLMDSTGNKSLDDSYLNERIYERIKEIVTGGILSPIQTGN